MIMARRSARGAITLITRMRALRMAITGLIGSWAASLSAQGRGITAAGMADVAGVGAAGADMAGADVEATVDAEPMRVAARMAARRGVDLPDGRLRWGAALAADAAADSVAAGAADLAAEVTSVAVDTWVAAVGMAAAGTGNFHPPRPVCFGRRANLRSLHCRC